VQLTNTLCGVGWQAGSRGQVNALLKELATFAAPKVKPEVPEEVEREEREVTRTMKLGEFAGFIVGANGSRVKSLGVRFGVELCVDRQGVLSITGLEESVSKAEKKVARLIAGQEQRSGTKQRSVLAPAPVATSASNQQVVPLSGQQSKQQVASWYWQDDSGEWNKYDNSIAVILESGFQSGSQKCNVLGSFQVAQNVYNVKVNSNGTFVQYNVHTKKIRPVKRQCALLSIDRKLA